MFCTSDTLFQTFVNQILNAKIPKNICLTNLQKNVDWLYKFCVRNKKLKFIINTLRGDIIPENKFRRHRKCLVM